MSQLHVLYSYLQARAATVKSRTAGKRFERGASALEWAIISAIVVGLVIAIAVVITQVVEANNDTISEGTDPGGL